MSAIIQIHPPKVNIHPLPQKAKYISYNFQEVLSITAWMPSDIYHVNYNDTMDTDTFYETYCSRCERNDIHSAFFDDFLDEDGEINWELVEDHCNIQDDGYYGQECPLGFKQREENYNFSVCEMAFKIYLDYRKPKVQSDDGYGRYMKINPYDSAALSASTVNERGELSSTSYLIPSNVFGSSSDPQQICWGSVSEPDNLRAIASNFYAAEFNNDLLPVNAFYRNSIITRDRKDNNNFIRRHKERVIIDNTSNGHMMDNLVIVDAELNVNAFFTLLCAGFQPEEDAPHVMLIPARETMLVRNGTSFWGYLTIPDALNKEWFISEDNLLIGQV